MPEPPAATNGGKSKSKKKAKAKAAAAIAGEAKTTMAMSASNEPSDAASLTNGPPTPQQQQPASRPLPRPSGSMVTPENANNDQSDAQGPKLLVLGLRQATRRDIAANQQKCLDLLQSFSQFHVQVVFGDDPDQQNQRDDLFQISELPDEYPQVFKIDSSSGKICFVGDWDYLDASHKMGTLTKELGVEGIISMPPPPPLSPVVSPGASSPNSKKSPSHYHRKTQQQQLQERQQKYQEEQKVKAQQQAQQKQEEEKKRLAQQQFVEAPASPPRRLKHTPHSHHKKPMKDHSNHYDPEHPPVKRRGTLSDMEGYDGPWVLALCFHRNMEKEDVAHHMRCFTILETARIPFETLYGDEPANKERVDELFEFSNQPNVYPQFFKIDGDVTTYLGDWKRLENCEYRGTVRQDLGFPENHPTMSTDDSKAAMAPDEEKAKKLGPKAVEEIRNARNTSSRNVMAEANGIDDNAGDEGSNTIGAAMAAVVSGEDMNDEIQDPSTRDGDDDNPIVDVFPDPPHKGRRPQFVVLFGAKFPKPEILARQKQGFAMLEEFRIHYKSVDADDPANLEKREKMFRLSGKREVPQFYLIYPGDHMFVYGDWARFESCFNGGNLEKDLSYLVDQEDTEEEEEDEEDKMEELSKEEKVGDTPNSDLEDAKGPDQAEVPKAERVNTEEKREVQPMSKLDEPKKITQSPPPPPQEQAKAPSVSPVVAVPEKASNKRDPEGYYSDDTYDEVTQQKASVATIIAGISKHAEPEREPTVTKSEVLPQPAQLAETSAAPFDVSTLASAVEPAPATSSVYKSNESVDAADGIKEPHSHTEEVDENVATKSVDAEKMISDGETQASQGCACIIM